MKNITKKLSIAGSVLLFSAVALTACGSSSASNSTDQAQTITEQAAKKLTAAEPYPLAQMNDSAELANLREKLLRWNDPNKVGYVTEMTQNGQIIATFTIKGKVSSTQSQILNTNYAYTPCPSCTGGGAATTVDSMEDDGSNGPSEPGVFFFDTAGVMYTWNGLYQYSDAPLSLTSKPLITMDAGSKPSTTAGQLKSK
jgi:hypothetical protein